MELTFFVPMLDAVASRKPQSKGGSSGSHSTIV